MGVGTSARSKLILGQTGVKRILLNKFDALAGVATGLKFSLHCTGVCIFEMLNDSLTKVFVKLLSVSMPLLGRAGSCGLQTKRHYRLVFWGFKLSRLPRKSQVSPDFLVTVLWITDCRKVRFGGDGVFSFNFFATTVVEAAVDGFLTAFFAASLSTRDLRITWMSFLLPLLSVNWMISLVETTWMGLQVSSKFTSPLASMMLEVHSRPTMYSGLGNFVTRT